MRHIDKLKHLVLWMCQDLPRRKINTQDALENVGVWLKNKHKTSTRIVETSTKNYDRTLLTWKYSDLVTEHEGFDIMENVNLQLQ